MMGYRGEDLDLRSPQTWAAADSEPADIGANGMRRGRGFAGQRGEPIWVDDTVMAATNHAFDVAVTHRAAEVRLEHLVYALTRIEPAAEILEARGLRVPVLRREAGTIVSSDIPISTSGAKTPPRRSDDLEDVLRIAADAAFRRNGPASVDDVLNALFETRRDQPAVLLLRRHLARPDIEPAPRTGYTPEPRFAEPRYAEQAEPRERVRMPAGSQFYAEPQRPARGEPGSATDSIQNARLDKLEQTIRALAQDLSGERKSYGGVLSDLQREIGAQRDDTMRFRTGLNDRIASMEQLVLSGRDSGVPAALHDRLLQLESGLFARLGEVSRGWSMLTDRLAGLEQAMHVGRNEPSADATALGDRIVALERAFHGGMTDGARNWAALTDRLRALETSLQSRQQIRVDTTGIEARLDGLENAVLSIMPGVNDLGPVLAPLTDRLTRIETAVSSVMPAADGQAPVLAPLADRLSRIETALAGAGSGVVDLSPLADRLASLERALVQRAAAETQAAERLRTLEEGQAAQRVQAMQLNAGVTTEIKQLAQLVQNSVPGDVSEPLKAMLNDRFQALAGYMERQRGETLASLAGTITERMQAVDAKFGGQQAALATLGQSLTAQEQSVAAQGQSIIGLQDTLSRMTSYQQALSGTLEQWRLDGTSDLGIISSRLEAIELASQRPVQLVEQLSHKVEATQHYVAEQVQQILAEKTDRRGFRYWLFGTNDWVGASWGDRPMQVPASPPGGRAQAPQSFRK